MVSALENVQVSCCSSTIVVMQNADSFVSDKRYGVAVLLLALLGVLCVPAGMRPNKCCASCVTML
jgi:hypothetical protein